MHDLKHLVSAQRKHEGKTSSLSMTAGIYLREAYKNRVTVL